MVPEQQEPVLHTGVAARSMGNPGGSKFQLAKSMRPLAPQATKPAICQGLPNTRIHLRRPVKPREFSVVAYFELVGVKPILPSRSPR
jgi:hypothetical protein